MRNKPKYSSPNKEAVGDFYFFFILLCIFPGFYNKLHCFYNLKKTFLGLSKFLILI